MSSEWQKAHLVEPRAVKPGSIMPSFSFSARDMNDLVAYLQSLGNNRKVKFICAKHQEEYDAYLAPENLIWKPTPLLTPDAVSIHRIARSATGWKHSVNGPNSISLEKKPANFTRPFYKQYSEAFWFYRVGKAWLAPAHAALGRNTL